MTPSSPSRLANPASPAPSGAANVSPSPWQVLGDETGRERSPDLPWSTDRQEAWAEGMPGE